MQLMWYTDMPKRSWSILMTSSWLATVLTSVGLRNDQSQQQLYISVFGSKLIIQTEHSVTYAKHLWKSSYRECQRWHKSGRRQRRALKATLAGFRAVHVESLQSVRIAKGVRRHAATRAPLPVIWTVAASWTQQPVDAWKVATAVNNAMEKPGGPQRRPSSAAGRAAKWKHLSKRQMLRTPNVARTKVYTILSLLLLCCLGVVLFYDFVQIVAVQHPDATTQHFTVAILVSACQRNTSRAISGTCIVTE